MRQIQLGLGLMVVLVGASVARSQAPGELGARVPLAARPLFDWWKHPDAKTASYDISVEPKRKSVNVVFQVGARPEAVWHHYWEKAVGPIRERAHKDGRRLDARPPDWSRGGGKAAGFAAEWSYRAYLSGNALGQIFFRTPTESGVVTIAGTDPKEPTHVIVAVEATEP